MFVAKNIPKGFSCGVVARPDERCGVNDIVVPVDCDKSVLKVAKNWCDGESIVDGDCFDGVNWQLYGYGCIPKEWLNSTIFIPK